MCVKLAIGQFRQCNIYLQLLLASFVVCAGGVMQKSTTHATLFVPMMYYKVCKG